MRKSTEKAIKKEWDGRMWPDLMRGLRTMTKEIEDITTGENFTFITDKTDNIRKWVELEKTCYCLELIARRLKKIAQMNAHFRSKELIKEVMEDT
jgi:hypothetical protein